MRRRPLMLVLLVGGGAIVNVAVAWGFAYQVTPALQRQALAVAITDDKNRDDCESWDAAVKVRSTGLHLIGSWFRHPPGGSDSRGDPSLIWPYWLDWSRPNTAPSDVAARMHDIFAWGWPRHALWCGTIKERFYPNRFTMQAEHAYGIPVGTSMLAGKAATTYLPTRPIWPGFAINTVFYAVVLWVLFAAPFALRRWGRIKRGRCPTCAYDLRNRPADSSACPECGAAVPPLNAA